MKNNTLGTICEFSEKAFGWWAFLKKFDASMYSFINDKIYVFSKDYYIRYTKDFKIEDGYPKPIKGNWTGFPDNFTEGIDASLYSKINNKVYIFKGSEYIRIDPNNSWQRDPGYPKPIAGNWNMPANFTTGVDAVLWNDKSTKVYFFKGSEFIRIDPANGWILEPGYPKPIAGNWPGMPADFATGIDAATWSKDNNRVYMFKNGRYVRINPNAGWVVESGYPSWINTNWKIPFPTTV